MMLDAVAAGQGRRREWMAEMAYAPNLDLLLTAGARYAGKDAEYVIEAHLLGKVTFATGQVVGCDPLTLPDTAPFTVTVAPGRYPLRAWVVVLYRDDAEYDRRVAALQLIIRDEPASRWQPAVVKGQDPATLGEDSFFGYAVDAGTGTLADPAALNELGSWDFHRFEEVYFRVPPPERPVPGVVDVITDDLSGANLISVNSGWGDGLYPTFIGYTASGDITSYVTDFLVIP